MLQYADEYVSAMYKEFQTITLKLTKKTENGFVSRIYHVYSMSLHYTWCIQNYAARNKLFLTNFNKSLKLIQVTTHSHISTWIPAVVSSLNFSTCNNHWNTSYNTGKFSGLWCRITDSGVPNTSMGHCAFIVRVKQSN